MRPSLGALLAIVFAACDRATPPSPPVRATTTAPTGIEVVPVVLRQLDTSAHLEGEIAPYEAVAVYPRTIGFVSEIPVDRGSVVHRGQLLVRLVAPEMTAQHAEARARESGDRATVDHLRAAARTPGVVAGHDVEVAEAALQADDARVRALGDLVGYLTVRAPFDAVVTERNVHPGALVGPPSGSMATPMLRIEQVVRLRLTVAVPETLVGAIAEGSQATFGVRAWPQQVFAGRIARVAHTLETRTRTMAVEIDVDNADGRLAPGMFADVTWPVHRVAPSLLVPTTAIVQTTEHTFVVRVRDGVAEQVDVRRGASVGDAVEVFGALQAGDTVARRGNEDLRSGLHVVTRVVVDAGAGR